MKASKWDRVVIYGFFGLLAAYGIGMGVWVLQVRSKPLYRLDQQKLGTQLRFAYQKFYEDNEVWPLIPEDAAKGYRNEAPWLVDDLKKAKSVWGLTITLRQEKPAELTLNFSKPERHSIVLPLERKTDR